MTETPLPKVFLFTDGSCEPNPGPGGWAAILRFGDTEKELCGAQLQTTNNRMELEAVIQGLKALQRPCQVEIITDSNYVHQGWKQWLPAWKRHNWRLAAGGQVKNQDLWMALDEAARPHRISITWVRGHTGHPENERCDRLANQARLSLLAA